MSIFKLFGALAFPSTAIATPVLAPCPSVGATISASY